MTRDVTRDVTLFSILFGVLDFCFVYFAKEVNYIKNKNFDKCYYTYILVFFFICCMGFTILHTLNFAYNNNSIYIY